MSMNPIQWSQEFEIGINVIDAQHRRIVDYINELAEVDGQSSRPAVAGVIDALLDYTYSHFAFEEALMEEAEYEFVAVHKNTHQAFTQRIDDLHQRFRDGDEVAAELGELLKTWLIEHIQADDQSYAPVVKARYAQIERKSGGHWISNALGNFFGRRS